MPAVSLTLQYFVITLAVICSAWVVLRKQFPNVARGLRIALALPLVREGRPVWMRAFGKAIAPPVDKTTDACGGCNSCDTGQSAR